MLWNRLIKILGKDRRAPEEEEEEEEEKEEDVEGKEEGEWEEEEEKVPNGGMTGCFGSFFARRRATIGDARTGQPFSG